MRVTRREIQRAVRDEPAFSQMFVGEERPNRRRYRRSTIQLACLAERTERSIALVRPRIQVARHELGALVDSDRRREAHLSQGSFQHPHNVGATEAKPLFQCGREAEKVRWRSQPAIVPMSDDYDLRAILQSDLAGSFLD